jgi:hypothetical protein
MARKAYAYVTREADHATAMILRRAYRFHAAQWTPAEIPR